MFGYVLNLEYCLFDTQLKVLSSGSPPPARCHTAVSVSVRVLLCGVEKLAIALMSLLGSVFNSDRFIFYA